MWLQQDDEEGFGFGSAELSEEGSDWLTTMDTGGVEVEEGIAEEGVAEEEGAGAEAEAEAATFEEEEGGRDIGVDDEDAKKLLMFTGLDDIFVRDRPLSSSGYSKRNRCVSVK